MFSFLVKGLMRDHHRSLFPVIIVSLGVLLTSLVFSWVNGVFADMLDSSARYDTGHIKLMTIAYDEISDRVPNDLAIAGTEDVLQDLTSAYPDYKWVPRIKFGGLLDIPDENGETRDQGPVVGMGLHLMDETYGERDRLNIAAAIVKGRMPEMQNEILVSDMLAENLNIQPGDLATLVGATSNGAMAIHNFTVSGTVRFGIGNMDRGAVIADIEEVRYAMDMADMSSEILGFDPAMLYDGEIIGNLMRELNQQFKNEEDPYSLVARPLADQMGLGAYLGYAEAASGIIVTIFIMIMSVVLWNTSLMGGIRRYGEVGVRLAIGETKTHIYRSMLMESIVIGLAGSAIGTAVALVFAWYLQTYGVDMTSFMNNAAIMMNDRVRAQITTGSYFIGFIPGIGATLIGTMIAGIAIFKRQTASLFKELEV